jgi:hypothetical protein
MSVKGGPATILSGLVLELDAGNIKSYQSGSTIWFDKSGNANNGTLANGPTFNTGSLGNIVFDGTNDYVYNAATTSTLNLTSSNGATMMCWLNINVLTRWTGVLNFWPGAGSNNVDFGWDITDGNLIRLWKNNVQYTSAVNMLPYSNQWILYTLISTTSAVTFYINNTSIFSSSTPQDIISQNRPLWIMNHWDNPVSGKLSTVQIYNRALTASEVLQNYNATKGRFGL